MLFIPVFVRIEPDLQYIYRIEQQEGRRRKRKIDGKMGRRDAVWEEAEKKCPENPIS